VEYDIPSARVEIAKPPRLRRGVLAKHRKHRRIVAVLILVEVKSAVVV
jgi:hypothetical protein